MIPPWMLAAGAAIVAAAGAASGAWLTANVKDKEIAEIKAAHAAKMASGYEAALRLTNEAQLVANTVLAQPPKRVRFCPEPTPGVPGTSAGPPVGGVPDSRIDRDYGPALLQFLAAERANRRTGVNSAGK
jgi:hypothetical protein